MTKPKIGLIAKRSPPIVVKKSLLVRLLTKYRPDTTNLSKMNFLSFSGLENKSMRTSFPNLFIALSVGAKRVNCLLAGNKN